MKRSVPKDWLGTIADAHERGLSWSYFKVLVGRYVFRDRGWREGWPWRVGLIPKGLDGFRLVTLGDEDGMPALLAELVRMYAHKEVKREIVAAWFDLVDAVLSAEYEHGRQIMSTRMRKARCDR